MEHIQKEYSFNYTHTPQLTKDTPNKLPIRSATWTFSIPTPSSTKRQNRFFLKYSNWVPRGGTQTSSQKPSSYSFSKSESNLPLYPPNQPPPVRTLNLIPQLTLATGHKLLNYLTGLGQKRLKNTIYRPAQFRPYT